MRSLVLLISFVFTFFIAYFVLTSFQKPKEAESPLEAYELQIESLKYAEKFDSALLVCEKGIQKAKELQLSDNQLKIHKEQFRILAEMGYSLEENLKKLKRIQKESGLADHPYFIQLYNDALTTCYFYEGDLVNMERYYQKTMEAAEQSEKWVDAAEFNIFLAVEMYLGLGDLFAAKQYIDKAEQILNKKLLPQNEDLPDFYNVHAVISQEFGDYDGALKSSLKSVELLLETEVDTLDLAYEYNNLGLIYNSLEDFSNAEKYYQKALDLVQELNITEEIAISLYNIGAVFYLKEEFDVASSFFKKSLLISNPLNKNNKEILENIINCNQQLADCMMKFEKLDSANYFISQAQKIQKKYPYRLQLTSEKEGRILELEGLYAKAINSFQKGLKVDISQYGRKSTNVANFYNNISHVYISMKDYLLALGQNQKGIESLTLDSIGRDWKQLPSPESIIDLDLMLSLLSQRIDILNELRNSKELEVELQDIYQTARLATEVLAQLNKKVMNKQAKRYWLNREAIPIYEKAIDLALELHKNTKELKYLDEAFQLSERSKSILLMEALQEQSANAFGGVPDSLIQKELRLKRRIANLDKKRFDALLRKDETLAEQYKQQIFQLEQEAESLQNYLEGNFPKYYELKYQSSVADLETIQRKLDKGTTFVEYFAGEKQIIAFVLSKSSAKSFSFPIDSSFQAAIYKFQNTLLDVRTAQKEPTAQFNQFATKAKDLFDQLVAPALIEDTKRLVLISDGVLGYIPFEVLLTEEVPEMPAKAAPNYSSLPYLLKKCPISYNYSGTLWLSQIAQEADAVNGKVLAMAPSYANKEAGTDRSPKEQVLRNSLNELPGAAQEVHFLNENYAGEFLLGDAANETNLKAKAKDFGILHLAMHGLVDEEKPEFSSLAMTEDGSKGENNFLYAYEIKQLDINASLVVLSACETGAGKYQRGEGVVSIGRGFMYAGAPSLLMTLWSLNDQSSQRLIEGFYKNLSAGMDKDIALQKAKIDYLDNSNGIAAHPALWACFIQLGNYSSLELQQKGMGGWTLWAMGGGGVALLGLLGLGMVRRRRAA